MDSSEEKDIQTQLNECKIELENMRKQYEYAVSVKDKFISNISHEIRTPLNAVIGFSEILVEREKNDRSRELLKYILNSALDVSEIFNDMLTLSSIKSGTVKINLVEVYFKDIIEQLEKIFREKADEKNCLLIFENHSELELVLCDQPKILQILFNLISNAIKFTKDGKVIVKIDTYEEKNNTMLEISVSDSGIGIDDGYLSTVFDCFDQEEYFLTKKYKGTGMGLYICKQLVEIMGGKINVKSEKWKGSTFTLKVPVEVFG